MPNNVRIGVSVPGAKQSTGEVKGLRDAMQRLQKQGAAGLGYGIGATIGLRTLDAVGGAISGVTDFMHESIQAASDLAESGGKVSVVFAENADEVERWASTSATAFGQSKQAALEAAGTYGNLFQAFGIGRDEATKMSMKLVELASDLASFNNTSTDDALLALRSGLSGETEPLKRYGIALSDARMRQTLMAQGVKNLGATLTPLQKSQAAYTLILQDSTLAQGDFARTSNGLANTIRSQEAELQDLKAELGTDLLPLQKDWEQGNLNLIRSLSLLKDVTSSGEVPRDKMVKDYQGLLGAVSDVVPGLGLLTDGMDEQIDAARDAAAAEKTHGDALIGVRSQTRNATGPTRDLAAELAALADSAHDAEEEVDDLASTLEDDLFGDAINAGNEARLKENIKDLKKQRGEVEKGTPKWIELTGEIAENRQKLFELHLEEAKKKGPQAVIDFLEEQKELFKDNKVEVQRLIDKYRALYLIQQKIGPVNAGIRYTGVGGSLPGRAAGGPVEAGKMYKVGEHGEEAFVPGSDGTIIPNGGGGSWGGGGGLTINIYGVSVLTPGSTEALGRQLEPIITRAQQKRGQLAGARAF